MSTVKLTAIGNSTGVILPKEILQKLRVDRGDVLTIIETPDGIQLTPYDPQAAQQMDVAEQVKSTLRPVAPTRGFETTLKRQLMTTAHLRQAEGYSPPNPERDLLILMAVIGFVLSLAGVLPTFFDRVTKETAEQLRRLAGAFGNMTWPPIPQDTKLREAPAYGQTIWEYAPTTTGVVGYQSNNTRVGGYRSAMERITEVLSE